MQMPLETGPERYPVEKDYVYASDPELRFDQKRLASLVGMAAIGLPLVMGIGALIDGPLERSISHFYYRRVVLGDVFVGTLVFIGALLFAYRGWNRKVGDLATVAGLFAFGVALFPTDGWNGSASNCAGVATGPIGTIHLVCAAGLFLTLAFFCLFVFTRVDRSEQADATGALTREKRARNIIYYASGATILLSMVAIVLGSWLVANQWCALKLTFWFEGLALCAFGASWIIVGRAMGRVLLDRRDEEDYATVENREGSGRGV